MERTIYLVTAIVGGTILVAQVIMQLFGLSGDTDADSGGDGGSDLAHGSDAQHEAVGHGNWFFGFLSFKALVAFCGLFGLTGLMLFQSGLDLVLRVAISIGAGLAGMLLVGALMKTLSRLTVSGTVIVRNAVGQSGSVYLRIRGGGQGEGKLTVEIQGRSLQLTAVTDGPPIPTGERVKVIEIVGDETLKVVPA